MPESRDMLLDRLTGEVRRNERGFTLVELLIVIAIIGVLTAIATPNLYRAINKARISAMAADAKTVFEAFVMYYRDFNQYPETTHLGTFEPLRSKEYLKVDMRELLLNSRADAYDSPDDRGVNQEFWLELTSAANPSLRILIADSDNAPISGGQPMNGIYVYYDGVLTSLR